MPESSIELLTAGRRPGSMTSDLDLVRAAQTGDAAALGMFLERHRAALHAHALTLVGHGADAQDAVQDTFLIALRKIGSVREPERAVGWLHTVLRSVCLTQFRGRHRATAELPEVVAGPPSPQTSPEEAIDALVLRDWTWTAIERLSEPLRVVMMLRHFSACAAYDDIAAVCGVPVGTVRSRLAEGRRRLADELLATAERAHHQAAARTAAERARLSRAVQTGQHLDFLAAMTDDVTVRFPSGAEFVGRDLFRAGIEEDFEDGVSMECTEVVAGPGLTIMEARFHNPVHDPFHCPPGMTQVHFKNADDQTYRVAFHYAPRPERQPQRPHLGPDGTTIVLV